ncbi:bifunctional diguanylate cyclase/phosphodiesterase [Gellertiella hungarica]|uniref:Diguanylate cyclase (GGDEF)-like protein/PAS domain S-box-containing protein n=1 Tax=Gellertiella hungarica TaxID=1572859 RepID=A0A7W6J440_9HYPH|nr:EAL domain-containing protein [Gellertiella hungarica]MBB4064425.1 diguanylate cyclase (GGDEF)-like protein/PAS domain S-box-containing protein [Gellertiella hungarica]
MTLYGKLVRLGSALAVNTRSTVLAATVVAGVVAILGFLVDYQNSTFYDRELRARVDNQAELIRAQVESKIKVHISTIENFANQMAVQPQQSVSALEAQMRRLIARNPSIVSIAIAPDFRVKMVVPPESRDVAVGSDLHQVFGRDWTTRNEGARKPHFMGPVLTDDMRGAFVVVYPVIVNTRMGARVWGAIEAVIDENSFYRETDLLTGGPRTVDRVRLALRDISQTIVDAPTFFGDAELGELQPVRKVLAFPGGTWEISAAPAEGWNQHPHNQVLLRILLLLSGAVILLPITASLLLLSERNGIINELQSRETQLRTLSQRLDLALESSHIGVWELSADRSALYFDGCAASLHGFADAEAVRPMGKWQQAVHPEDRAVWLEHFEKAASGQPGRSVQFRIVRADGTIRHLRSASSHIEETAGSRTAGIVWDVTDDVERNETLQQAKENTDIKNAELELALDELSSRERELEELSRKLDLALDSYNCGIWEASLPDGTAFWDERMDQLFNHSRRDGPISVGQWEACLIPEDRTAFRNAFSSLSAFNGKDSIICRVPLENGECRYVRLVGQVHHDKDGSYTIVGMAFDMTQDALMTAALKAAKEEADAMNAELRAAKERIEHNALHDPLTGIANRRRFDLALDALSRRSHQERLRFAVLHLDLDRFKQINDTLGHAAGDAMLVNASEILRRNVHPDDLVARIGGDEFVILVEDRIGEAELSSLAQRIIDEMRHPVDFEGFPCRCGVSIGIATAAGQRIDARKLLINADVALYRAKNEGRNCFQFFTQDLHAEIITNKRTADEILAGLERGEFTAWYQPQFDARTFTLIGAEALVRWNHPSQGLLGPEKFLGIAEELNVVQALDRIVLETALRDKYRLAARGIDLSRLSVNVSARRLNDASLYETLKDLPFRPGEIAFELVEAIFLDDRDDVMQGNLERIKDLGIEIEIDDFGTGHTSIVSLLRLKPKRLKIDRQLVKPIMNSPKERALVRSIIEIARSLGVETVAEGVETMEHADMLLALGCDILQGYAFARPLSFDDFAEAALRNHWIGERPASRSVQGAVR